MIDADPRLNSLLWGLMTDDKRDFWNDWLNDVNAPAFAVTEIDWSLTHLGSYAASRGTKPPTRRLTPSAPGRTTMGLTTYSWIERG